jgi:membrane-anchored protein YejM (alkaline phosphatase superfamily)
MQQPLTKSAITIVVDRLHTGFLGAYGNVWVGTTAMNSLAAESVVFDRHYATSLELNDILRSHWGLDGCSIEALNQRGANTILFTDSQDVVQSCDAEKFTTRHFFNSPNATAAVSKPKETLVFRFFAELIAIAEQAANSPYYIWCYFESLGKCWDFPLSYRSRYCEEGDPEPYPDITIPFFDYRNLDELLVNPDERQSVLATYAAGIKLFDEVITGVTDFVANSNDGNKTLLTLTASRGFPLGEHSVIGIQQSNEQLYGESIHLPLIIRYPDKFAQTVRSKSLTEPDDLRKTIERWFEVSGEASLFELANETQESLREYIVTKSGSETAVITPLWFLRRLNENEQELYVKPDDRWEVNNVTTRCPDVVQELMPFL